MWIAAALATWWQQGQPTAMPDWTTLLLGPLGLLVGVLGALRAYHSGSIITASVHKEALAAQAAAHAETLKSLQDAHETDRAYLIQHVADERARTRALELDFATRLEKREQAEGYWRDMALGLLKVADAERRQREGRPPRGGATT